MGNENRKNKWNNLSFFNYNFLYGVNIYKKLLYACSVCRMALYAFSIFWFYQAEHYLFKMIPSGVVIISPMLLGMLYKFIVPIMAGFLTFKIPSGKLISIFHKLMLPRNFVLILTVIIRFVPTIAGEFRTIKEAMKVRGFTGNFFHILSNPLRTLEYAIVPLIFRSIKVGDELSAAAIVRGIEKPIKRDSYYSNRLCKLDIIIITTSFVLFILCLI